MKVTLHFEPRKAANAEDEQRPAVSAASRGPATSDYDLAIDEQVEKLLELRQRLTYFFITAAVVVLAFAVNLDIHTIRPSAQLDHKVHAYWLVAGSIVGLGTAGLALLSLYFEHRGFQLHVKHRYERQEFSDLSQREQRSFDRIGSWSARTRSMAFLALFAEILLLLAFLLPALSQ
jgi:hypothetical protein